MANGLLTKFVPFGYGIGRLGPKMLSLTVKDFSCIDGATIDIARLTVIIGPQASGKSILSKLAYFSYNVLDSSFAPYAEVVSVDQLRSRVASEFLALFPSSAWGNKSFEISLTAGLFEIKFTRSRSKTPRVDVHLSEFFVQMHREFSEAIQLARSNEAARGNASQRVMFEFNISDERSASLSAMLGPDYFKNRLFVPAGRSFFVNTAKMSASDIAKSVDSITAAFGSSYKMFHEGGIPEYHTFVPASRSALERSLNAELFGGRVIINKEVQSVEADDGRIIPFSALSSGQQELLPLWIMINFWTSLGSHGCLSFIEEPEAHLFPKAQNALTTYLCSIVADNSFRNHMVITTHSPYLLSKINNILYAGSLALRFPRRKKTVSKVVDETAWLGPNQVAAYAIIDREVKAILDEDGLIDATFLDSVSGDIAREYGNLLEMDESWSNAR